MSVSLIDRVRERLVAEASTLSPGVVAAAIRAESGGLLGDTEVLSNLRLLETELTGAGILEPLLCAPTTTDVLVTAPDAVWVDDGNGLHRSAVCFPDEGAVRRLAQRLALLAGRRLDEAQPWVDGQLTGIGPFTVRLHAVLPPVAAAGTCLSLRVLRPATQNLDTLSRSGAIPAQAAELVHAIIRARLAFLISGGTGCRKTAIELRHRKHLHVASCAELPVSVNDAGAGVILCDSPPGQVIQPCHETLSAQPLLRCGFGLRKWVTRPACERARSRSMS